MKDYSKIVKALRQCAENKCEGCAYAGIGACDEVIKEDAADAIEELQDTVQAQDKALKMCAEQLAKSAPKHGEWIWENYYWHCSECGDNPTRDTGYVQCRTELFSYCPHCGAKMPTQSNDSNALDALKEKSERIRNRAMERAEAIAHSAGVNLCLNRPGDVYNLCADDPEKPDS